MRKISLGEITLTTLRNYRWEVLPTVTEDGKLSVRVREIYVVTDANYTSVPEGQQQPEVDLTTAERNALASQFRASLRAAAAREQVTPDVTVEVEL